MPMFTSHVPGTFCWPELAALDTAAAAAFYKTLFGWEARESPTPEGSYTVFMLDGRDAAAMYPLGEGMLERGMHPHWNVHIAVADLGTAIARAEALGGRRLIGPEDVLDYGRMVVIADPAGAPFILWQAGRHHGAAVLGEPGALGWTQLNTSDPAGAKAFYPSVIGWTFRDDPMGPDLAYTTWLKSDGPAGGLMPMPKGAASPAHWLCYFAVADVDAAHRLAVTHGAQALVPPTDIPGAGRFAVLADPQGAFFAVVRFGG